MTPGRGNPPHILKNNMDAKELMIGDKVMVKVLSQIPDTYVLHTWTANDYSRDIQVKPITLTPEILEKNGFIKVNSQRYDYGYPDTDCYVKVNPKKNMIHVNGRNANSNLYSHSFVHQLQRALRCCGLWDIANNFVV